MAVSKNIKVGRKVLQIEAKAVENLKDRIDKNFDQSVNTIFNCIGRVIVTGMGKSGLISQKIASTFASTGTPSQFVHPSEAVHGDLGMITKNDIILVVSNRGETHEIIQMMPAISRLGVKVIAFVGRKKSTIADLADFVIDTSVDQEACPFDLAPTASTTATLAMGDALAIALLEKRGFQQEDFALLHPGGTLGKKLLLTVKEIMHSGDELPIVDVDTDIKTTLLNISSKRLGIAIVTFGNNQLAGIITDGDIRRGLEHGGEIFAKKAEFLMTKNPKWISEDSLAISALEIMEKYSITSLIVYKNTKHKGIPDGVIHIHDIIKTGIM